MPSHFAPYASHPDASRGRLIEENKFYNSGTYRSPYQHDRDRIIHSRSFRRLKDKTQVFITSTAGDHSRTRLTHSLEVAQIARTLSRALAVDEDLTEAIALAHDIGHPPFGHDGEHILNRKMKNYGGFNHNLQTLRNVALLEKRYPGFRGLNLTYETLDGLLKHNGPLSETLQKHHSIAFLLESADFAPTQYASIEAQIAAIADDIAYNNHDIDDGVRSGLISVDDLCSMTHLQNRIDTIIKDYPQASNEEIVGELIRRQIADWVEGVLQTARDNLQALAAAHKISVTALTAEHIRHHDKAVIEFAPQHRAHIESLRQFLRTRVYQPTPERRQFATLVLSELFEAFMRDATVTNDNSPASVAREVCDYIAGMSDMFALAEYQKIIGETPP